MFHKDSVKKFAPILIGLGVSGLLLVLGFAFISGKFTRASDIKPQNVSVTDISKNSASITWSSGVAAQCVIQYNTSITAVSTGSFAPEVTQTVNHKVDLTLLAPGTTYYYNIRCGDSDFDNEGVPFSFATKDNSGQTQEPVVTPNIPTAPPTAAPTTQAASQAGCNYTDCNKIKEMLGQGCTSADYYRICVNGSPTPTLIEAPHITSTPTPTP